MAAQPLKKETILRLKAEYEVKHAEILQQCQTAGDTDIVLRIHDIIIEDFNRLAEAAPD